MKELYYLETVHLWYSKLGLLYYISAKVRKFSVQNHLLHYKDFCYLLASIRIVFRVFRQIRIYTFLSYCFSKFWFLVSELASGLHSTFVTFSVKVSVKWSEEYFLSVCIYVNTNYYFYYFNTAILLI